MKLLTARRYAELVDSLRRCVELLDQAERPGVTRTTEYWRQERERAVGVARRVLGHCGICGRALKDYRLCEPDDPAMNCGGDCWGCVGDIERWLGEADDSATR